MLGFLASPACVTLRAAAPLSSATCARRGAPKMKAKSGGKSKQTTKAKSKASGGKAQAGGGGGEGFGKDVAPSPSASDADSDADTVVVQDGVDGSTGSSTPKRVFSKGRATLEDPMKEVGGMMEESASIIDESDGDEAVAKEALRLAAVRARSKEISVISADPELRWPWGTSADSVVEMLAVAKKDGRLDESLVANRDFVTQRVLYRFSSAILQAEAEGAEEEARNMRELRREMIEVCWHYDRPLREELYRAEARMVQALRAPDESNAVGEVEARCGATREQVNGFWLVIYGAVAAWEVRETAGSQEAEKNQLAVHDRVKIIAAGVNASGEVAKRLSPCLLAAGKVLVVADPEEQGRVLAELTEEDVAEMRSIVEQVRLWPAMSYGPFADKLQAIVDYAVDGLIGGEGAEGTGPFRFSRADIERGSRLLEFKRRNASKQRGASKKFSLFK